MVPDSLRNARTRTTRAGLLFGAPLLTLSLLVQVSRVPAADSVERGLFYAIVICCSIGLFASGFAAADQRRRHQHSADSRNTST